MKNPIVTMRHSSLWQPRVPINCSISVCNGYKIAASMHKLIGLQWVCLTLCSISAPVVKYRMQGTGAVQHPLHTGTLGVGNI